MAKYIRIPIEVDAFQYDGDLKGANGKYYVPDWATKAFEEGILCYGYDINESPYELYIKGDMQNYHVPVGNYIIKEKNGEIYTLKPDRFRKEYVIAATMDELGNELKSVRE